MTNLTQIGTLSEHPVRQYDLRAHSARNGKKNFSNITVYCWDLCNNRLYVRVE
jgi:hypothetical protein